MKIFKNKLFLVAFFILVILSIIFVQKWYSLRIAHSTFENYYAFRGCVSLVKKTSTYGICKLSSGEQIKIVKYNNKWYLDGDLPWACVSKNLCFGI